jgi:hypothetical protein
MKRHFWFVKAFFLAITFAGALFLSGCRLVQQSYTPVTETWHGMITGHMKRSGNLAGIGTLPENPDQKYAVICYKLTDGYRESYSPWSLNYRLCAAIALDNQMNILERPEMGGSAGKTPGNICFSEEDFALGARLLRENRVEFGDSHWATAEEKVCMDKYRDAEKDKISKEEAASLLQAQQTAMRNAGARLERVNKRVSPTIPRPMNSWIKGNMGGFAKTPLDICECAIDVAVTPFVFLGYMVVCGGITS